MERATSALHRLKGPVVPINICFNADGSVHEKAVAGYVDWLCDQGVPVLLLTAGSSEYGGLSDKDVWSLTKTIAEVNAGRSLFVTSTRFWNTTDTRNFLVHADKVGADAVKVQIGNMTPSTRDALLTYFDLIEDASDIPLLLWTIRQPPFPVDAAAELAKRPNIIGMKNDGEQFSGYYDYIRATRDEQFAVLSGGQMRNFVFGHQIGSTGYLCTTAPFRPDLALKFYDLVVGRKYEQAWQFVFRYEDPWLQWAIEQGWLQAIKTAIHVCGHYPNNLLSPPHPPLPADLVERTRNKIDEIFGAE